VRKPARATSEQTCAVIATVLDVAGDKPVDPSRTLDIGGDQGACLTWTTIVEENPALGWRAIRLRA